METEPTDIDDDIDNVIKDVDDAERRINDEVHLPEYYLKQIEEFDESEFIIEDYPFAQEF